MTRLVVVLVGVACVVVIVAGGLWLWQQMPPPASSPTADRVSGAECASYIETLNRDANEPGSVTAEQKQAATDGVIRCRDAGIR